MDTTGNGPPDDSADAGAVDDGDTVRRNGDQYVVYHDFEEEDLTVTLSLALAEVGDVSPSHLIPQFTRYADPDALDRLFSPRSDGSLREGGPLHLEIEGFRIVVHSTGRIEITP